MENTVIGAKGESFKQPCECVLGIGAVPVQRFGAVYEPETALKRGTVFPDLDFPFFGGDSHGE